MKKTNHDLGICPCHCTCGASCDHATCPCLECRHARGTVAAHAARPKAHLWSAQVHEHWHPPPGFFEQSARAIARGLRAASDSKTQAMRRLVFYVNRAGKNLRGEARERLEEAKEILRA